jgi:quercetin dioxygenase-like cupin family protein
MASESIVAIDTNVVPWEERFKEELGSAVYRKLLLQDPDTGMEIRLLRYPAGVVIPWHTHPCGHGIYVLEGTLTTHEGSYSPGCFVWFPAGSAMWHGATSDADVTMLFITNRPLELTYVPAP